ncbi:hypothetical protein B9G69_009270 [Bdellovibrio sp. SKB1291214]|uniref:hypothetical protein n=1 Tax=Bdellovibrio sp. SKB1291214 TaxID=1732569 RepID=UPI000B51D86D|nr:hypothetical protein [Bdellovibrio sp. SKB1291214]UYL07236.1 hypothetical protein B9G69_009270 [Bdellovibrio sp. SKB1291214]
MSDIFYVVLLILGALLIYFRPLARATNVSIYWEIAVGSLAIVAFSIHMLNTYVVQKEIEEGLSKQPCGSSSPQGVCYNLDRTVCESAWNSVDQGCKDEAAPVLKERPGALIGPIVNRCKARRMDKVLRYNRIKADTALCRAYFDYIDNPN